MQNTRIIFFGSTPDSVIVLSRIFDLKIKNYKLKIVSVVTQPPRPVGRNQILTPAPVEIWAKQRNIPVLSFPNNKKKPWLYENEQTVIDTILPLKPDLIVSACYGQKIPWETIQSATFGGLNVHPSILPRWRGGDPVPWAILTGDHQIGVTVVTLAEKFDTGRIVAQKKIPIKPTDFSVPLRTELFSVGAGLLIEILPKFLEGSLKGKIQDFQNQPYAKRLTRHNGFEPWEVLAKAMETGEEAERIERKWRALHPWPGLWTEIGTRDKGQGTRDMRLKILTCHLSPALPAGRQVPSLVLDTVQLEGKNPVAFKQFQQAYLAPLSAS